MRELFLNTQTTGLDPQSGHRVIEIGIVEMIDKQVSGRHFHSYLKPDRAIDPMAEAVHGINAEFLADKPVFADIADEFLDFVHGASVMIHNAPFDTSFLNAELKRLNKPPLDEHCTSIKDTLQIARERFPGKPNNLDALCARLQINNVKRNLNDTLLDASLLAQIWLRLENKKRVWPVWLEHFFLKIKQRFAKTA